MKNKKVVLFFVLLLLFVIINLFLFPVDIKAVSVTINSYPATINSPDSYQVSVGISGASNATNYLRVCLYKDGSIDYFGETYNGSDWYVGGDGKSYFPVQIVNSTASAIINFKIGNPTSDQYSGTGTYKLKIARYTSSGSLSNNDLQIPADVQITYVFPTLTSTPTPTTSSYKSTYKINSPRDGDGDKLSSVQIYVDGSYVHHEDDEVIEFYNGHECYTGIYCDLGTHTVSLRKNGYSSWEDTQNFTAGISFEVNPILTKLSTETPAPTPTKTSSSTPAIIQKPSPIGSQTSTLSGVLEEKLSSLSSILGVQTRVNDTPLPDSGKDSAKKIKVPYLAIIFIFIGLCFITVPVFSIIRNVKKENLEDN